jgi:hypothetical protein
MAVGISSYRKWSAGSGGSWDPTLKHILYGDALGASRFGANSVINVNSAKDRT